MTVLLFLGYSVNPIDKSNEPWLCMKLKSKFDGAGMDKHQRPDLNVVLVIDISGSMASLMSTDLNTTVGGESKLDAAKKCMLAICEKFTNTDFVGLVAFDDRVGYVYESLFMNHFLDGLTYLSADTLSI